MEDLRDWAEPGSDVGDAVGFEEGESWAATVAAMTRLASVGGLP
ncbi:MAG: hypothetical protein OSA48_09220 [Akkermansiaceae bacterium]|nr:hypothetical protein [Akkermansiaceae bacterium]